MTVSADAPSPPHFDPSAATKPMDMGESLWQTRGTHQQDPLKGAPVQVSSKDQTLKVLAMTRFHFVTGLPRAGAGALARLLGQNPRFVTSSDSAAAELFGEVDAGLGGPGALGALEPGAGTALLRGTLDAVHHARPMDAVVFDHNHAWLAQTARLAEVFPLSRFIVMVRDPAEIAGELAEEAGRALSPDVLMGPDGALGRPIGLVQDALQGPQAERVLLVDRDRLLADPKRVLTALYGFIREPVYAHDYSELPLAYATAAPMLRRRTALPSEHSGTRRVDAHGPVWRRLSGTGATMLLPEAG